MSNQDISALNEKIASLQEQVYRLEMAPRNKQMSESVVRRIVRDESRQGAIYHDIQRIVSLDLDQEFEMRFKKWATKNHDVMAIIRNMAMEIMENPGQRAEIEYQVLSVIQREIRQALSALIRTRLEGEFSAKDIAVVTKIAADLDLIFKGHRDAVDKNRSKEVVAP